MQLSALMNARHGHKLVLNARQELANRAGAVGHRCVHRQYRRGFGRAVAFVDANAELVEPGVAHRVAQLFRPGDHVAQTEKIVGVGEARVVVEESVGGEQRGAAAVVDDFRDHAVMQRADVEKYRDAGE